MTKTLFVRTSIGLCSVVIASALLTMASLDQRIAQMLLGLHIALRAEVIHWPLVGLLSTLIGLSLHGSLSLMQPSRETLQRRPQDVAPLPGLVWTYRHKRWLAVWKADPRKVRDGYRPARVILWEGKESVLTSTDKTMIANWAARLQREMQSVSP